MPRAKEIPAPRTKKANRIQKFNAFDAVLLILLTLLGLIIVYPCLFLNLHYLLRDSYIAS